MTTVTLEFSTKSPEGLADLYVFANRVLVDGKLVKNRFGTLEEGVRVEATDHARDA